MTGSSADFTGGGVGAGRVRVTGVGTGRGGGICSWGTACRGGVIRLISSGGGGAISVGRACQSSHSTTIPTPWMSAVTSSAANVSRDGAISVERGHVECPCPTRAGSYFNVVFMMKTL